MKDVPVPVDCPQKPTEPVIESRAVVELHSAPTWPPCSRTREDAVCRQCSVPFREIQHGRQDAPVSVVRHQVFEEVTVAQPSRAVPEIPDRAVRE